MEGVWLTKSSLIQWVSSSATYYIKQQDSSHFNACMEQAFSLKWLDCAVSRGSWTHKSIGFCNTLKGRKVSLPSRVLPASSRTCRWAYWTAKWRKLQLKSWGIALLPGSPGREAKMRAWRGGSLASWSAAAPHLLLSPSYCQGSLARHKDPYMYLAHRIFGREMKHSHCVSHCFHSWPHILVETLLRLFRPLFCHCYIEAHSSM